MYTLAMEKEFTIQEMARVTGLSEYTLRYYERVGLLDPIDRAKSGHRRYGAADLEWIKFLVFLRATGMSIRQMQECAELKRGGDATRRERLAFLEEHRERVQEQRRTLEEYLANVDKKIHDLQASLAGDDLLEPGKIPSLAPSFFT